MCPKNVTQHPLHSYQRLSKRSSFHWNLNICNQYLRPKEDTVLRAYKQ